MHVGTLNVILVDDEAHQGLALEVQRMLLPLITAGTIRFDPERDAYDDPGTALEVIKDKELHPAVVILDQRMPGTMDGLEFLRIVRGVPDPHAPHDLSRRVYTDDAFRRISTQIIILSGNHLDRGEMKDMGAHDHLRKGEYDDLTFQRYVRAACLTYVAHREATLDYRRIVVARSSPEAADIVLGLSQEPSANVFTVTTLFADLVSYSVHNASIRDPAEVLRRINAHHKAMKDIVVPFHYGVFKTTGDEVMVSFGAPKEYNSDPLRAAYCAVKMIEHARRQRWLDLSIGINTGLVAAGVIEASMEYDVIGEAVDLAKRLESAAGDGEIFVGPETYNALHPWFSLTDLGEILLKGQSAPIKHYKLNGIQSLFAIPGRIVCSPHLHDRFEFWEGDKVLPFEEHIGYTLANGNGAWFLEQGIRDGVLYKERAVALYAMIIVDALQAQNVHLDEQLLRTLAYTYDIGRLRVSPEDDVFGRPSATLTLAESSIVQQLGDWACVVLGENGLEKERDLIQDFYGEKKSSEAALLYLCDLHDRIQVDVMRGVVASEERQETFFREAASFRIKDRHPEIFSAACSCLGYNAQV